jgi:hypothetical protein
VVGPQKARLYRPYNTIESATGIVTTFDICRFQGVTALALTTLRKPWVVVKADEYRRDLHRFYRKKNIPPRLNIASERCLMRSRRSLDNRESNLYLS